MPNGQIDKERRHKFLEYYNALSKEWFFIDEAVKNSIFRSITQPTGERLEEFIETYKCLITYTEKKYKKIHYPDKRNNIHPKIKKGMFVSLIIQPRNNPGKYCYVMRLYFTYKKILYDLEVGIKNLL